MILFFEDVDNLLRTIHTGVRVEQRRVVGRIEHHVGTHLFGIGFDRGKNLFLDLLPCTDCSNMTENNLRCLWYLSEYPALTFP